MKSIPALDRYLLHRHSLWTTASRSERLSVAIIHAAW